MTTTEIKAAIGLSSTFMFVRQVEVDNPSVETEWLSHWDNDKRIRVTLHQDVAAMIKNDPSINTLALKKEVVLAHVGSDGKDKAEYLRYIIITPRKVELAF